MAETEHQCRRVRIREIYQVRPRRWMLEEEGQQVRRRQGPRCVCVRENQAARWCISLWLTRGSSCAGPLVLVKDMQRLDDAVHGCDLLPCRVRRRGDVC